MSAARFQLFINRRPTSTIPAMLYVRGNRARSARTAGVVPCLMLITSLAAPALADKAGDDLLQYVEQTRDWYQRIIAMDQTSVNSQDVIFRDTVRRNAAQAIKLGFDYAKAQATLFGGGTGATTAPSNDSQARLMQSAAAPAARVTRLQTELDALTKEISTASAASQPILAARHDELISELNLATARRDVLQERIKGHH